MLSSLSSSAVACSVKQQSSSQATTCQSNVVYNLVTHAMHPLKDVTCCLFALLDSGQTLRFRVRRLFTAYTN